VAWPKYRLTLLIGGSVSGDKKLKPLIANFNDNPHALQNILKFHLSVMWKSHCEAWITWKIFHVWFADYFMPEMKEYCRKNNLTSKILLILDNASSHDTDFEWLFL
jgi:hypothetical protein